MLLQLSKDKVSLKLSNQPQVVTNLTEYVYRGGRPPELGLPDEYGQDGVDTDDGGVRGPSNRSPAGNDSRQRWREDARSSRRLRQVEECARPRSRKVRDHLSPRNGNRDSRRELTLSSELPRIPRKQPVCRRLSPETTIRS